MYDKGRRPDARRSARCERFEGARAWPGWQDFVVANFPSLEFARGCGADFRAEIEMLDSSIGGLATMRTSAHSVTRTRALVERAEDGCIKLLWCRSGDVLVEQDGRSSRLAGDSASVCDTARPYRLHLAEGSEISVLNLPYRCCAGWERISAVVCAAPLPAMTSRAALAALCAAREGLVDERCDRQSDDVLSAVHMMLSSSLHHVAAAVEPGGRSSYRFGRARRYICEHAGDPGLSPDTLAAALCISRRSLYQLFSAHGLTPARLILETLLERCRTALLDPACGDRSVTEIAFEFGFTDVSSFCRLYKRRYGVSPSLSRGRPISRNTVDSIGA